MSHHLVNGLLPNRFLFMLGVEVGVKLGVLVSLLTAMTLGVKNYPVKRSIKLWGNPLPSLA